MSVLEENIKRVNNKLQQLLKQYQLLQKENDLLQKELIELKSGNEKNLQYILDLKQQVAILKMAAVQMDDSDKKAFEKNINQYIREIDKCIGLLSE